MAQGSRLTEFASPLKERENIRRVGETKPGSARYRTTIAMCSLKVPESRTIADLLLRNVDSRGWHFALVEENVLQI